MSACGVTPLEGNCAKYHATGTQTAASLRESADSLDSPALSPVSDYTSSADHSPAAADLPNASEQQLENNPIEGAMAEGTPASAVQIQSSSSVVLTVFWEGTANVIDQCSTQIGAFAAMCTGVDITRASPDKLPEHGQLKISFDGCGVTDGCAGTLWGSGLRAQTETVRQRVAAILKLGVSIKLNVLGLSRGGVAAIFLAQELSLLPDSQIQISMFLFDPVPGNWNWTTALGCCNNATQSMDLSACTNNLKHVFAMYPHEPMPDISCHAPVLPRCVAATV